MESLINLYTNIFNSMDTWEKTIFIFWSICLVMFWFSFCSIIYMVVKDSIVNTFKRKPRPQRF